MKFTTSLPHEVREIDHVWIPMPDGVRLSARLWLPAGAEGRPVPAILEYIPYRKNDFTATRDAMHHAYFAGHGYACVRVDIRGSGDSEGILRDEYLQQEQDDGLEILRWIAAQPWCTGDIGMIGISWGGFNGLQIAAHRPPELKTIITICSTDDRYADDVHYMGGCLLGDNLSWASVMFAYNACPPDPAVVGDAWREMWRDRLEHSGIWVEKWLRHQRRDDYWKHGSICEDFSDVSCSVMAVSGWADGYTNAVFRLLEGLDVPRQGLIGPWSHKYPHIGKPGPAIGFLQEALRWWDHWLKGMDTGIMAEPMLRAWMQDSMPPHASYTERPGRWVSEKHWTADTVSSQRYFLSPGKLSRDDNQRLEAAELSIQSPLNLGLFAGKWCSYSYAPDLPGDQRQEDGGALVFETPPLDHPLEILGQPVVELRLTSNRPVAMVAVRLSDVMTDGKATRITYGLLNLTHRESHEHPSLLTPDTPYTVRVPLNYLAHRFSAGHKVRVSISTSYWPLAWLPPEPVRLTILTRESVLELPIREPREEGMITFADPEAAPPPVTTQIAPPEYRWTITHEMATDEYAMHVIEDRGTRHIARNDLQISGRAVETYRVRAGDIRSAEGETHHIRRFQRGDWRITIDAHTLMSSDVENFYIRTTLRADEGDSRFYEHNTETTIPRDHM